MGTFLQDFGAVGYRPLDLQNIIQCSCSGNPIAWIGYLGDKPKYQADPQRIQPQGGPQFGGNAAKARQNWAVGVPDFGGRDCGRRSIGGGHILPTLP